MHEIGSEAVLGQRQQARPAPRRAPRARCAARGRRDAALARDPVDPLGELLVEVVDGREAARGEERRGGGTGSRRSTLPFSLPRYGAQGLRREVVVAGELEEARDGTGRGRPDPLEHDALEVVVEDPRGTPPSVSEREHVAAQEALERLVEREAREQRARPRQHEHEAATASASPCRSGSCRSWPQSTCACSPGSVSRRRNASPPPPAGRRGRNGARA